MPYVKRLYRLLSKLPQFFKFFLIWGSAAVVDLAILFVLTEFVGLHYLESVVIGFVIVTSAAFYVHKKFTFQCDRSDKFRQYASFVAINLAWLGLYASLIWFWAEIANVHYMLAAFVSKFVVFVWNYLANKYLTFRKHHAV